MEERPIYCGECADRVSAKTPPESQHCQHFPDYDMVPILLAAAGAAIEEGRNSRRVRYFFHQDMNEPSHPPFQEVVLEEKSNKESFKLPLSNGIRIHYKKSDNAFTLHGPEDDPDVGGWQIPNHLINVVARRFPDTVEETVERANPLMDNGPQDPLYIHPDHEEIALRFRRQADGRKRRTSSAR